MTYCTRCGSTVDGVHNSACSTLTHPQEAPTPEIVVAETDTYIALLRDLLKAARSDRDKLLEALRDIMHGLYAQAIVEQLIASVEASIKGEEG